MSRKCRVLNNGWCEITQGYSNNHMANDIVGGGYTLDYIVAHSDGVVTYTQDGLGNLKGSWGNKSYGNYVIINHQDKFYTLYAHMAKGLLVKKGDKVKKGQRLGYMSDSGNAYGGHLHFEVRNYLNNKINPTEYLDKDLIPDTNYKINDKVEIKEVYVSSSSDKPLIPAVKKGIIKRINSGSRNPYLIYINDRDVLGWVNDNSIVKNTDNKNDELIRLAKEVIQGKYGNGEERKRLLGNKYNEVQNLVNEMLR